MFVYRHRHFRRNQRSAPSAPSPVARLSTLRALSDSCTRCIGIVPSGTTTMHAACMWRSKTETKLRQSRQTLQAKVAKSDQTQTGPPCCRCSLSDFASCFRSFKVIHNLGYQGCYPLRLGLPGTLRETEHARKKARKRKKCESPSVCFSCCIC